MHRKQGSKVAFVCRDTHEYFVYLGGKTEGLLYIFHTDHEGIKRGQTERSLCKLLWGGQIHRKPRKYCGDTGKG